MLVLEGDRTAIMEQPIVLSEFGGIALASETTTTWGYSRAESGDTFAGRYLRLMSTIHALGILAGFCYTQFADTYQEANGLLYDNRTPKFPIEQIARATRGQPLPAAGPEQQAHNVAAMKASAADAVAPGPPPVPVTIGERPE